MNLDATRKYLETTTGFLLFASVLAVGVGVIAGVDAADSVPSGGLADFFANASNWFLVAALLTVARAVLLAARAYLVVQVGGEGG